MTKEELKTFKILLNKIREQQLLCHVCQSDCPFNCESMGNTMCAVDMLESWCEDVE